MTNTTKYRIKFWLKDCREIEWERFDNSMEDCLSLTKIAIAKEYGDLWTGSVAICGPQGNTGIYAF